MPFLRGQQVNSGRPISLIEDASYHNEAFVDHEYPSDLYTQTDDTLPALIRAYESERPTALQDMLPILVLPEITPANTSSSALTNGKAFRKQVSCKDGAGAAEETLPKNEGQIAVVCNQIETRADILMPVMQQETFAIASAENPAEKVDVCCPNSSVRPREECFFAHANEDDEDDSDPYKNMASVIYSSDEDMGDDAPNDLRHYYKHGQNQFKIDHMKAIGLQIEDSDESQAWFFKLIWTRRFHEKLNPYKFKQRENSNNKKGSLNRTQICIIKLYSWLSIPAF